MQTIALAPVAFAKFTAPVKPDCDPSAITPNNEFSLPPQLPVATAGNCTPTFPGVGIACSPQSLNVPTDEPFVSPNVFPFPYTDTVAFVPNGNTYCAGKLKVHLCC